MCMLLVPKTLKVHVRLQALLRKASLLEILNFKFPKVFIGFFCGETRDSRDRFCYF